MELLRFTVRNQKLSGGKARIVSDSIDYVEASFDFRTDDWSGLSKWAHFTKDETTYDVNLIDDKITKDMHLNLDAGTWEVKLHGTDSEGTERITTSTAYVIIESYGNVEGEMPLPEIPLTAAEQIDAKSQLALDIANAASGNAGEAIAKATEVFEAAERGDFNGKDGEKGDPGVTPEIQIGNVATLEPGAEAIVTIGGTAEKPIFNFAIPKGEKGKGIEEIEAEIEKIAEAGRLVGNTADTAPQEVMEAIVAGKHIFLNHTSDLFGVVFFTNFSIVTGAKTVVASVSAEQDGELFNLGLTGTISEGTWEFSAAPIGGSDSGISAFDLGEMGISAIPVTGGELSVQTDTSEILEAFSKGPVKFAAVFSEGETEIPVDIIIDGITADGMVSAGIRIFAFGEELMLFAVQIISAETTGEETGTLAVAFLPLKDFLNIPEKKIAAEVDLSGYSDGTVVETYPDGSTLTYTFEFDSDGNPVKITDSDGNETVLTW